MELRKHFAEQVSRVVTNNGCVTAILYHRTDQPDLVICTVVFICHGIIDQFTSLMNMFQLLVVYKA